MAEVADTPQAQSCLAEQRAGTVAFRTVAPPLRFDDTPTSFRRPAPALGEHTEEVLAEAGIAPKEIERLRGAGVIA